MALENLVAENVTELVESLNFAEKVNRSLELIERAHKEFGDRLVVANSLGKDSSTVWHLAKRVSPDIRGFIITTRFKPAETKQCMAEEDYLLAQEIFTLVLIVEDTNKEAIDCMKKVNEALGKQEE